MGDNDNYSPARTTTNVVVPVTVPGVNTPIYIPGSVTQDDVYTPSLPSSLATKPGEKGASSTWDANTLDSAIEWLNAHAEYLDRMYRGMTDIDNLMRGPDMDQHTRNDSGLNNRTPSATGAMDAPGGPLGGFRGSSAIAGKHAGLYKDFNTGLKTVVENLFDAADALSKIKEKYANAEKINALGASDVESIFADLAQSNHNV